MNTMKFATSVKTDPKTARRFLREVTPRDERPGKGKRWTLPDKGQNLTQLKRQFRKWASTHTRATTA